ncbi:MAG: C4-type zinc ribbon domain-containing protein [Desulfuromonadia bacterium]
MHKQIGLLVELQQLDLKLDSVESQKVVILENLESLDALRGEAINELAAMDEELAILTAELTDLESQAAVERENIDRSEKRLKEIKTQKEYQAVSREISIARKNLEEIEAAAATRRENLEAKQRERDEKQKEVEERERVAMERRHDADDAIKALDDAAAGERSQREAIALQISSTLMRRYTQLRSQRRGVAIVEARNGSCCGCNMNIPPQLYNNLFKSSELITCPHCQRVLYLAPQQG